MTSAQIPQNRQSEALTDAITKAIKLGDLEAQRPLADLRTAADPRNSATVANIAWGEHATVMRALQRTAKHYRATQPEGTTDPVAAQLEDLVGQLRQNLETHRANGGRY